MGGVERSAGGEVRNKDPMIKTRNDWRDSGKRGRKTLKGEASTNEWPRKSGPPSG